jgi:hypothetical protein
MISLRNFNVATENFIMADDIDKIIDIETTVDEEVTENVELEEAIDNSEDIIEETEQMLATLEFAAHAEAVIQEFGWSRPVATMLNRGQDVRKGIPGDLEVFLGVTMPANESLDMVSSAYDDNTVAALEGFKETMEKFWKWIKEQAVKIKDSFLKMWERITFFFMNGLKVSKRLAEAIKRADIDEQKLKEKKFKVIRYVNMHKEAIWLTMSRITHLIDVLTNNIKSTVTTLDSDKPYNPMSPEKIAEIKRILHRAFPTANITDNGVIEVNKYDVIYSFYREELTLAEAGWDKTRASNTEIVEKCQKIIDHINVTKEFINAAKVIEKKATKFTKTIEGSDSSAYKDAKENAKKLLNFMNNIYKFLSLLSKTMSNAIRQFIRAQRAVLACRK